MLLKKMPSDYVVKPVQPERLRAGRSKSSRANEKGQPETIKQIQLNTDKGKALINTDKIILL